MFRELALFVSLAAFPMFGGNVELLSSLPGGAVSTVMQLDAAGNIYVAGSIASASGHNAPFVAKVSADGLPKGLAQAGPFMVTPTLSGMAFRERLILVWTRPD